MPQPSVQIKSYWSLPADQLLGELHTTPDGLSLTEAKARLKSAGPNTLKAHRRLTAWGLFLNQFKNPLVLILLFGTLVSAFARDFTDALVILTIVIGSALITFYQEYSASNAVEKLRSRLSHKVSVLRDGTAATIPAEEVVPGDVVLLSAGSLIPADGVLLESTDCFVNQAVLTGETFPVEKKPGMVGRMRAWQSAPS